MPAAGAPQQQRCAVCFTGPGARVSLPTASRASCTCRCHCACLWARLEKIYYGATYEDVKEHGRQAALSWRSLSGGCRVDPVVGRRPGAPLNLLQGLCCGAAAGVARHSALLPPRLSPRLRPGPWESLPTMLPCALASQRLLMPCAPPRSSNAPCPWLSCLSGLRTPTSLARWALAQQHLPKGGERMAVAMLGACRPCGHSLPAAPG